jgi:zinc protease
LKMAEAGSVAQDEILRLIYGSHPAGQADPTPAEISALTPEAAAAWHRQRYAPANTVLSVIGRVRASEVASRAEKILGSWNTPAPQFSLPPEPQPAGRRHISLFDRKGAPQTTLELGNLLIRRSDPQYFATVVLQQVLGGGADSRLQRIVEAGEALNATSSETTAHYTGCWRISAAVRTEATGRALQTILNELRRLCEEPVSSTELDRAKSAVTGGFALTLEHPNEVINYSYTRHRYGFSSDYWESYPSRIQAMTAEEVQAVARRYYQPDRAHIVAVGDGAKIRADLAKLGPVE